MNLYRLQELVLHLDVSAPQELELFLVRVIAVMRVKNL